MRLAFVRALLSGAQRDGRVWLVNGDLGYEVLEPFVQQFPQRYLNVGVAEQNLIGVAAGLAVEGWLPVAYSIATFAAFRAYEFTRNDVCFQNLNVKIVGVGAGLSYPQFAATHQAVDDIAALRAMPNLVILNPGDPREAALATAAMLAHVGPVYLRLGKRGEPAVHQRDFPFAIGRGVVVRDGRDVTVLATGPILAVASAAAKLLGQRGLSVRLISLPTVVPLDVALIRRAAQETRALCTVEEAFITGGVGSAVAELLAEGNLPRVPFRRFGLPAAFPAVIGSQDYLRDHFGLSAPALSASIGDWLTRLNG